MTKTADIALLIFECRLLRRFINATVDLGPSFQTISLGTTRVSEKFRIGLDICRLLGNGETLTECLGLFATGVAIGVGGRVRLRCMNLFVKGVQVRLQNLLIGGEILPLLILFSLAFWTLMYAV